MGAMVTGFFCNGAYGEIAQVRPLHLHIARGSRSRSKSGERRGLAVACLIVEDDPEPIMIELPGSNSAGGLLSVNGQEACKPWRYAQCRDGLAHAGEGGSNRRAMRARNGSSM